MSAGESITAAELRRRVRAAEELRLKTCELAASEVLAARRAADKADREKKRADAAASEASAVALRLFDNAHLVAELTEVPVEELQRAAKPVPAHRADEVVEGLRRRAEQGHKQRRRRGAPSGASTRTSAVEVEPADADGT